MVVLELVILRKVKWSEVSLLSGNWPKVQLRRESAVLASGWNMRASLHSDQLRHSSVQGSAFELRASRDQAIDYLLPGL